MGSGISTRLQEAKAQRSAGNSLYKEGKLDEALAQYKGSLQTVREVFQSKGDKKYLVDMAESLKGVAALLAAKQDAQGALSTYVECLSVLEQLEGDRATCDVVVCRYAIGSLYFHSDRVDEALEHYCRALEEGERITPSLTKEQFDMSSLHKTVASIYLARRDLRAAVVHTEKCLKLLEAHKAVPFSADETQQRQDIAACNLQLGNLFLQLADERKAQDHFGRVLAAPGSTTEEQLVNVQIQLGMLAKGLHGPHEALKHYMDALERHTAAAKGTATSIVSNLHGTIGILLSEVGELDRAEEHFRACLSIRQVLAPDSLPVAIAHQSLAGVLVDKGSWADAIPHLEKASDIRSLLAPGTLDLAVVHSSLGALYEQKGNTKMAADQYAAALKIRRRLAPSSEELAAAMCSSGSTLSSLGKNTEALQVLREAVGVVEKANPLGMVAARVFQTMGDVLRRAKPAMDEATREEVIDMYGKALHIFERWSMDENADEQKVQRETVERALAIAAVSHLQSEVMASDDTGVDAAVETLRKAVVELTDRCRYDDSRIAAKSLVMTEAMGWLLLKVGRFERAVVAFRLCIAQLEKLGATNSVALPQLRYGLGLCLRGSGQLPAAYESLMQAMVLTTITSASVGDLPFVPAEFFLCLAQVEAGRGHLLTAYEWLERAQAAAPPCSADTRTVTVSVRPGPPRPSAAADDAAPVTRFPLALREAAIDKTPMSAVAASVICDEDGRNDLATKTAVTEVQGLQAACALWRSLHASPQLDSHVLPLVHIHRERVEIRGEFYEDVPLYYITNRCTTSLAESIRSNSSSTSPKKRAPLNMKDLADIARSVACALRSMHSLGVAHGSISPPNVVLPVRGPNDPSGEWALCPPVQQPLGRVDGEPLSVLYAPPEVLHQPTAVAGQEAEVFPEASLRADMWALGCLLVEVIDSMLGTSIGSAVAHLAANDIANCTVGVRVSLDAVLAQGRVTGWEHLHAEAPLGRVLRGCLVADPARRISSFYAALIMTHA